MNASIGAGLGVLVALLWGSADILATLVARHVGTLRTTLISQFAGMIALLFCGCLVFWFWHYNLIFSLLSISAFIGILTGFCAAIGYYAFYYALELGPVALASPITASSSCLTFLLSILFHREQASLPRMGCIVVVLLGVTLASTSIKELRQLFHARKSFSFRRGIYFAIAAMIAFGLMDFGIGVSASISGWFLPVLWTRVFSLAFLALLATTQGSKIEAFRNKKVVAQNENYGRSYLDDDHGASYQRVASFTDSKSLADLPTLVLSSNVRTSIHSRPSSLRRTLIVPMMHPSPLLLGQQTLPHSILELRSTQSSSNKSVLRAGKHWWISFVALAGLLENIAVLIFSLDTRITTIGFTSAIASSYSLVGVLFGVTFYHEHPERIQICGIVLCILGIFLLAV
jgi:uncharacterized membrane protein